ncbi:MAG: hydroxyethylthiazole kinase, partial [Bauldia sp.]
ATTAAFATVRPPLAAAVYGLAVFGAAGAEAASKLKGPGHIPQELCDALYRMDAKLLKKHAEIRLEKV